MPSSKSQRGVTSKLKPKRSRWIIWTYLVAMSLVVLVAGLAVVLRHVRNLHEQINDVQHDLHMQQRVSMSALVDRVADLSIDPRPAHSSAKETQHFAEQKHLPTKRLERIIDSLPAHRLIPRGSVVAVHRVFSQSPATVAEISVMDPNGRFLEGVTRVDVEVFNGSRRLRQVQIALGSRAATTQAIALLLDCSKSMEGEPLTTAKVVAQQFVNEIANPARIQLWQFSDTAAALTPWTFDPNVLVDAIHPLAPEKGTALYLAIQEAVVSLSKQSEHRSLIVLTDGEDSFNKIAPESLVELCQHHQITLHAVALGNTQKGFGTLEMLSAKTGGTFYSAATASNLYGAFQKLADTLRTKMYRIVILDSIDPHQPLMLRVDGLPETLLHFTTP